MKNTVSFTTRYPDKQKTNENYKIKKIYKDDKIFGKFIESADYRSMFRFSDGFSARWGSTEDDNPPRCTFGMEIADIEISTICGMNCSECYKSNTTHGNNMSLENFKIIFDKLPKTLSQIAFGIGDVKTNPDLYRIIDYCIENEVVPNITVNGNIDDKDAEELSKRCGAVAVSHYDDDICFNAIDKLTKHGLKYINIHKIFSEESYEDSLRLLEYINSGVDDRLRNLCAVVFLTLKPKGNRNTSHPIKDIHKYKNLLKYAINNKIKIGFDSCAAPSFIKSTEMLYKENIISKEECDIMTSMSDPCESTLFSIYINVDGKVFPCSFMEGCDEYNGIDLLNSKITYDNFVDKVWNNSNNELAAFRDKLLCSGDCNNRRCPKYDIYPHELNE